MKTFFSEFKKFITRGNVIDMAVGVIVGSSFTAIVNGLCNNILKPITNWMLALILKKDTLSELYTILQPAYLEGTKELDLANSIYIDWGAFINAIINFILIALVLFTIVKIINKVRDSHEALSECFEIDFPSKDARKEMKKLGIKRSDKAAVEKFYSEKAKKIAEEKAAAEEKARLERLANPTTEELLQEIRDLLKKN